MSVPPGNRLESDLISRIYDILTHMACIPYYWAQADLQNSVHGAAGLSRKSDLQLHLQGSLTMIAGMRCRTTSDDADPGPGRCHEPRGIRSRAEGVMGICSDMCPDGQLRRGRKICAHDTETSPITTITRSHITTTKKAREK